MPEIRDITDPLTFIPEEATPWWIWLALILVLLLIFLSALFFLKRKIQSVHSKSSLDEARQEISLLREASPEMEIHETATQLSLILRRYLASAFRDPALYETDEEFKLRPHALKSIHPSSRSKVTEHLSSLSQLKYAPVKNIKTGEVISSYIDQAEAIINNIELSVSNINPSTLES